MKLLLLSTSLIVWHTATAQLTYPTPKKVEQTDNYFGTTVSDPYRWMEDDKSEATRAWVGEENKVTFSYLDKIPYRKDFQQAIEKVFNYPKYTAPFHNSGWYYFYKN